MQGLREVIAAEKHKVIVNF